MWGPGKQDRKVRQGRRNQLCQMLLIGQVSGEDYLPVGINLVRVISDLDRSSFSGMLRRKCQMEGLYKRKGEEELKIMEYG